MRLKIRHQNTKDVSGVLTIKNRHGFQYQTPETPLVFDVLKWCLKGWNSEQSWFSENHDFSGIEEFIDDEYLLIHRGLLIDATGIE